MKFASMQLVVFAALVACGSISAQAEVVQAVVLEQQTTAAAAPRYLADIELHTEAELLELLERAEALVEQGTLEPGSGEPVRFVLHGPEALSLINDNYAQHKTVVDLAARLTELDIVDIRVCETWMGGNGVMQSQLPHFVGTVRFGPAEERRLLQQDDYVYF